MKVQEQRLKFSLKFVMYNIIFLFKIIIYSPLLFNFDLREI